MTPALPFIWNPKYNPKNRTTFYSCNQVCCILAWKIYVPLYSVSALSIPEDIPGRRQTVSYGWCFEKEKNTIIYKTEALDVQLFALERRRCSVFVCWPHLQTLLSVQVEACNTLSQPSSRVDWQSCKTSVRRLLNDGEGMQWHGSSACRRAVPFLPTEASQAERIQKQEPWKWCRLGQIIWKEN